VPSHFKRTLQHSFQDLQVNIFVCFIYTLFLPPCYFTSRK